MSDIVFCGFGELGQTCLKILIKNNYTIKFILTHKDLLKNGVDTFAKDKSIPFFYNDLRRDDNLKIMGDINGDDLLVSINYRYILEKFFFSRFKFAINIHGSLLPQYRGRTPHVWSIINGEEYAGITCHLIDEGVDTGAIVKQEKIKIENDDTGFDLLQKYISLYPSLLLKSLLFLESGNEAIPQNLTRASFFGKREPVMGYIDFTHESSQVINFIRAQSSPYPGAYCFSVDGKKLIIDKVEVSGEFSLRTFDVGVPQLIDGIYYVRCQNAVLKVIECRKSE